MNCPHCGQSYTPHNSQLMDAEFHNRQMLANQLLTQSNQSNVALMLASMGQTEQSILAQRTVANVFTTGNPPGSMPIHD